MISKELLDLAFAYRKTALWEKIGDREIFAFRLEKGEPVLIAVMGKIGEHCAIAAYPGNRGLKAYISALTPPPPNQNSLKRFESFISQDCIQLELTQKNKVLENELEEIEAHAKKNGISMDGNNAYPSFVRYFPFHEAGSLSQEEDQHILAAALKVAISLSQSLESNTAQSLGIPGIKRRSDPIPIFRLEDGKLYPDGECFFPKATVSESDYLKADNPMLSADTKKLPRSKNYFFADLGHVPRIVRDSDNSVPYFPGVLFMIDKNSPMGDGITFKADPETQGQKAILEFDSYWLNHGYIPEGIVCVSEKTYAFLKDYCEKTGIEVSLDPGMMENLYDIEESFYQRFTGEESRG
ncbi:MAG: hypothetical protein J5857_10780, partial [Treponema sp.]|nr:hypothetical protein [Treponema sp.]